MVQFVLLQVKQVYWDLVLAEPSVQVVLVVLMCGAVLRSSKAISMCGDRRATEQYENSISVGIS